MFAAELCAMFNRATVVTQRPSIRPLSAFYHKPPHQLMLHFGEFYLSTISVELNTFKQHLVIVVVRDCATVERIVKLRKFTIFVVFGYNH